MHVQDDRTSPIVGLAFAAAFAGCVLLANWLTNRYGFVSVGFGLTATAGTYAAGLSFGLRDATQETGGLWIVLAAIAFLISELADLAVYTPLRQRQWVSAVIASNLVGAALDTVVFLQLAGFPIRSAFKGQMVGKALMILPALAILGALRRYRRPAPASA
jgi:uncharacterized PurR-regulated membrane protein YhhQ (DUF165 family)